MAEPKFTPGPWQSGINPKGWFSNELVVRPFGEFPHGEWVADCGPDIEERQANARLIAASPEMYEALERVMSELPTRRDWLDPVTERMAKAALAKARGEAQ